MPENSRRPDRPASRISCPCFRRCTAWVIVPAWLAWVPLPTGGLFLEQYLAEPVENLLGSVLGEPVARRELVEVGNLDKLGFPMHKLADASPQHLDAATRAEWGRYYDSKPQLLHVLHTCGIDALVTAVPELFAAHFRAGVPADQLLQDFGLTLLLQPAARTPHLPEGSGKVTFTSGSTSAQGVQLK